MRLLYASCPSCPSHWMSICRNMVVSMSSRGNAEFNNSESDPTNDPDGEAIGDDGENMVSSSKDMPSQGYAFEASRVKPNRDKHLRYRTRVFAAECLSHLPTAVGSDAAHFDLSSARKKRANAQGSCDWLVLHVQELISLAYQISTIQFENMRPIGVGLLSTIIDKFEMTPDPDLPGHLLLEQYQAQLVSAVRTALDSSSGPILLEAGLQLATKIMTSGIISGDQAAVKRIFSLISRPLNDFKDLYYPSFAEWVSCKIKIRLLAAHASLKCYTYAFLRRHHDRVPDEFLALLPLFSKSSSALGKYWIQVLKDYSYIFLGLNLKRKWNPFLDGIQLPLVSSKLQSCFEEAWPVILQAVALDAMPVKLDEKGLSKITVENMSQSSLISGYSMVELECEDYRFLWGFALIVVFQGQHLVPSKQRIGLGSAKAKFGGDSPTKEMNPLGLKLYEIVLPVFQFLSTESFFAAGFLTVNICQELLQVFLYSICLDNSWNSLAISVLSQIVQNCPEDFLKSENFSYLGMELCLAYLFKNFQSTNLVSPDQSNQGDLISPLFVTAKTLIVHFERKKQFMSVALAFLLIGYRCIRQASTELCLSKAIEFIKCAVPLLKNVVEDALTLGDDGIIHLRTIFGSCLNVIADVMKNCVEGLHLLENKRSDLGRLLQLKLAFTLEQNVSLAKLANETGCPWDNKDCIPIGFAVFKCCAESIRTVFTDSNLQVQAIGLQVLKSLVQRCTSKENNSLLLFIGGVLVRDIFTIMQKMLKKPIVKESVTIAGECLRILMLLQTVSKTEECQRGFMNLLLEAIVMVFSASEDVRSQEANDIRNTAVRLVSHLAQIPSSAVHLKDVLLSLPSTHRQQLQVVLRASVTQDHNPLQMKPVAPSLEIKLPAPAGGQIERDSLPSATQVEQPEVRREREILATAASVHSDEDKIGERDDEDEDDDWDAFQSFPASTGAAETDSKVGIMADRPDLVEDSSASESRTRKVNFQESNPSQPLDIVNESNEAEDPETGEQNLVSDSADDGYDMEVVHDFKTDTGIAKPSDDDHDQEIEDENVSSQEIEDEAVASLAKEEIAHSIQLTEDAEGSVKDRSAEDHDQRKESLADKIDEPLSTDLQQVEGEEGSSEVNTVKEHEVKNGEC
ncbi:hypothetical protein AB3S75_029744 [Citrus x aurantiifolia]